MSILSVLTDLAACVCAAAEEDGSPEPCWCGVVPGASPLLDPAYACDGGGMAWVRLASTYPSVSVGEPDIRPGPCASGTGIDIEIGIARPYPYAAADMDPPDTAESLAMVEQQVKDARAMRRAVRCCSALDSHDYVLSTYTPFGPNEGVYGGTWTVVVGLT